VTHGNHLFGYRVNHWLKFFAKALIGSQTIVEDFFSQQNLEDE